MFKIYIWNSYFPRLILPFFLSLYFFLPTIYQKLFHYLQVGFFISVDISKAYVMSSPTSQSSPVFSPFFNKEKISAETATKHWFLENIYYTISIASFFSSSLQIWSSSHIDEMKWSLVDVSALVFSLLKNELNSGEDWLVGDDMT